MFDGKDPINWILHMEEITTPQTLKIGHIKKKRIQALKYHIKHQQKVLQPLKDNATLVQNEMKQ